MIRPNVCFRPIADIYNCSNDTRMRTLSLLFGLPLIGVPTSSIGQSAEPPIREVWIGEVWVANVSVDPANCNLKVAAKVGFGDVVGSPASWLGKYIAVEGYWKGRTLFVSRTAASGTAASGTAAIGLKDQLGLYGRDALIGAAPKRARSYIAVGKLSDCKRLWDAAPMVMGYCHYHASGPYLALAEMTRR